MREKILINKNWKYLADTEPVPIPKNTAGMYRSAKTERLQWGPGNRYNYDGQWSIDANLPPVVQRWEMVDLPHDYIITQTPDENETNSLGYFKYHNAWYRRHLTFDESDKGKRIAIYFEGITGISDIYINSCFLKHNNGGYTSFEVDITDYIDYEGDNVIAVHVDPNSYETWWYAGGGIYRNVWLVKTDKVSVDLWGVYSVPQKQTDGTWKVPVEVTLRNTEFEAVPVSVHVDLVDPYGKIAGNLQLSGLAEAREKTVLAGETAVENPLLWDIDDPKLYTLKLKVFREEDTLCDTYDQRIGFRTIKMDPNEGLFLNDRHVKVKGVCAHMDFGLTGKAVPDNICRYKVQLIKEMGANAYRCAHYPHNEATMDALDEMGILCMAENRRFESCEEAMEQAEALIRRDRNHPSVFIWSTSNEEMVYHGLPQGHNIDRALRHLFNKLDPTRPTTAALGWPHKMTLHSDMEVIGANYSLKVLDELHAQYPDKPFISTENCAVPSSRGWYDGNNPALGAMDARDQDRDPNTWYFGREGTWKYVMERKWNMGCFQWDAFEHRGEAAWPRLCSASGAIDLFLQKKEAFYQNQSHWLDTPMIHMLPHWNHQGMEGMPVNVWVYTNCEEAELILNGESLGRRAVEKYTHLEWDVPYRPGEIEVIGYNDGKIAARDGYKTTGKAKALKLKLDNNAQANGMDIAVYTCYCVDENGLEVPDAAPTVHFSCNGCGAIVGTGSANWDHSPVPCQTREMYAGKISVAVRLKELEAGKKEKFTLFARAEGLNGAYLTLEYANQVEEKLDQSGLEDPSNIKMGHL